MPNLAKVIAVSNVMKTELIQHHSVSEDDIAVVGWPQMDHYIEPVSKAYIRNLKQEFLSRCGSDSDATFVVFACNSMRLGKHEPSLVAHLAERLSVGSYGENICFFVRPHPQDLSFKERFSAQLKHESVYWEEASLTNLSQVKDLFLCADVVISTQGSISLDAVAFDCCVINVAFDGDLRPPYEESVKRYYEMDHFQPVIDSGGVAVVRNDEELDEALRAYIANTNLHAQGRAELRGKMLEPFDGNSAQRAVKAILNELPAPIV